MNDYKIKNILESLKEDIIAVDFARPARAAFAKHQRPTIAAEQLGINLRSNPPDNCFG